MSSGGRGFGRLGGVGRLVVVIVGDAVDWRVDDFAVEEVFFVEVGVIFVGGRGGGIGVLTGDGGGWCGG